MNTPTQFRIIAEETISFKNKNKLFIIITKEDNRFGIEVMTKDDGFGRKYSKHKSSIQKVFNELTDTLSSFKEYEEAVAAAKFAFSFDKLNEVYFSLKVKEKTLKQAEIGKLMKEVKFTVDAIPDVAGKNRKKGWITIKVSLNQKTIGEFVGIRYGDNFSFSFF